jgi:hypothetical protein
MRSSSSCHDKNRRERTERNVMVQLLSKQAVAGLIGVSTRTVDRLRAEGALRAVKVGTCPKSPVRFEPAEIERFITKGRERN